MKTPLTPAGIEPATFRFIARHLNHCTTAVPSLWGRNWIFILFWYTAMAQAVSRRSLTAKSRVRFLVCPCKICGGQRGTRTSCPEYFACAVSVQFHQLSIIMHAKPGNLPTQQCSFGSQRSIGQKIAFTLLMLNTWVSNILWQTATPVVGWSAGRTWKNSSKWYT